MGEENNIELKLPKGKIKPKHVGMAIIFGIFVYVLCKTLESVFAKGFENPNYAIVVIALILLLIGVVCIYIIRQLSKESEG